jgi:hypothetical protein
MPSGSNSSVIIAVMNTVPIRSSFILDDTERKSIGRALSLQLTQIQGRLLLPFIGGFCTVKPSLVTFQVNNDHDSVVTGKGVG